MRILQIYDSGAVSCGVMSVIMNWYRNIDINQVQFDFLFWIHKEPSYDNEIRQLGGNVYYLTDDTKMKNLYKFMTNVKKFMALNAHKYDVIHLHSTTFSFPYLFYAKKYGAKKCIAHAHSISLGNTKFGNFRNKFLVIPLNILSTHKIACSELAGRKWFGVNQLANVDIILNGIDTSKYRYDESKRDAIRNKLGISKNTIVACHISNMSPIKNVPFVLETFKQMCMIHKNTILIFIGKENIPVDLQRFILLNKLENNVVNLGVRKDVYEILQAVDVCLMPSKNEGLGLVAVESQAANVPVLVSPGFPEEVFVSEKISKLELNCIEWAKKAIEVSETRKIETNLENLVTKFDSKVIAKKILSYYQKIIR